MPGGPVFVGGRNWDGFERVVGVDALAEESAGAGVWVLGDERVFLKGGEDEDLHYGEVFGGADRAGDARQSLSARASACPS
ncbi:hypothetical protein [Streptomyces mirabilis]|uniref:hypothetical protein n=1 Tax=Streptomyces mirabilis TaxID=68239 RepID=UPI0033A8E3BE